MDKKIILLVILAIATFRISAQYFKTGDDPVSIRWRNIQTLHFQLIYPEEFDGQAQRMAKIMEKVYEVGGNTLNYKPKKIPFVFHTQAVSSNGLLAWAPRRVELFTLPHQAIYPQDWLEQLSIHEFRHVVQVGKVAQNLPKIIPVLLGQQGSALFTGLYLPFWFLEGDAVVTETVLSDYGRGRSPSFLMEIQAQVVEKGRYSLEKAYHGSYRDFVPDHYKLGYYLVGGARSFFGPEFWEKAVENVGRKPFSLTPFNSSIKKTTGYNQRQLYNFVFDSLTTDWLAVDKSFTKSGSPISKPTKVYTNYGPSFFIGENQLLSYKTALNRVPQFVIINNKGEEKRLLVPGSIFDESISMAGNLLVWAEQVPDARWQHSGKSLIHFYDIKTNQETRLVSEFKGLSPSVSPDKKKVAMVESDFGNNYYLSVYEISENRLVTRFQANSNNYFFAPKWLDDERIVCILLKDKGKVLTIVNPYKNEVEELTEEWMGDIKQPVVEGNKVYFISSYDGKNSLYVLDLADRKIHRIYTPRFGAENPAIQAGGEKIIISDYTADGFRLLDISGAMQFEPIEGIEKVTFALAEKLAEQETGSLNFYSDDSVSYTSEPYRKFNNLFHFHSWAPLYIDTESYEFKPGVSLMSQNMLGTAETILGYKWDVAEKTGRVSLKFVYTGLFPAFSAELTTGNRASDYLSVINHVNQQNEVIWSDTIKNRLTWGETNFSIGSWVPLNLSGGKYQRLLQPEIRYDFLSRKHEAKLPEWFTTGNSNVLNYRLYYHLLQRKSHQDIVPKFGLIVDANFKHSVGGNINPGNLASFQVVNYLPGLFLNHGLMIYNGYQVRNSSGDFYLSDNIKYPRGWAKVLNHQMYSLSIDYKFPVVCPDWNLGKVFYLKRLKANLYYDLAFQQGDIYKNGNVIGKFKNNPAGLGAELTADTHFFRFYAPANVGLRIGYLPEINKFHFGLLYSINFNSF